MRICSEGELKKASEIANKVDMKSLFAVFVSLLRSYGDYAKSIGTIEKEHPDSYEAILYLGKFAPQILSIVAGKSPPEELGAFIKLTMKLIELSPKLDNIATLPAEEKIQVGTELTNMANEYDLLWKKLEQKIKTEAKKNVST
jgi:hypothetical protein